MTIKIYPYKAGSRSATLLGQHLGARVLKLVGSRWRQRQGDTVINWGSSHCLYGEHLNEAHRVLEASNKLTTFQNLRDTGIMPEFWTNQEAIPDDAFPIVCRTVLNGHSGVGIVIADNRQALVNAPLYVKYIKKQEEYRVHVVGDRAIFIQRKARRNDADGDNVNYRVRNLANGFNFVLVNEDDLPNRSIIDYAVQAVQAMGLDFGAVDLIWNRHYDQVKVLEINCAPGLEDRTAAAYAQAFRELIA